MFTKVFEQVFKEQSQTVVEQYKKTGELPPLNDEDTAKRFEAAISLVYEDAFEGAV
jgi:hypothetical protein